MSNCASVAKILGQGVEESFGECGCCASVSNERGGSTVVYMSANEITDLVNRYINTENMQIAPTFANVSSRFRIADKR